MSEQSKYKTRYTLLERVLIHQDEAAWSELINYYERFAYYLVQRFNIPDNDKDDLVQMTLIKVSSDLDQFDRARGRFRSWFSSIVHRQCQMFWRKSLSKKEMVNATTEDGDSIEGQSVESDLDQVVETEWRKYICDLAIERISSKFNERKLRVMKLALLGHSTSEIAEVTGYSTNSIYSYQSQIRQAMMAACAQILAEIDDSASTQTG